MAATRAVEQAIGHLANAWSLRRWRGQLDRLRDDFRPPARWCASVAGGSGPHLKDHHDTRKDLNSPGIPVGESVEMRADYLRPRLDLLRARLEPGERILAQGRAFEPNSHCDSFELSQLISGPGCAVIVTGQRVLWVSRDDQRWVRVLPFAVVRSYTECTQAHRYALALDHEALKRWQCVPAHRFLFWSWGNAEDLRPARRSVLGFSRRDTAAARAIRTQLQAAGVPAGAPRSLPKRQWGREVPYRVLRA